MRLNINSCAKRTHRVEDSYGFDSFETTTVEVVIDALVDTMPASERLTNLEICHTLSKSALVIPMRFPLWC